MMQPVFEIRRAMIAKGYTPIPVVGKKPPIERWQKIKSVSDSILEKWDRNWPHASNTGILTRLTPTLDLDLLNELAAVAAENLVRERFEKRGHVLSRVGRAPKRAIPFRAQTPFKKLTTVFAVPAGEKIEFLADGQQFVAHGVHPDTQKEYVWADGDPTTIAYDDLPEISATEAEQLQNDIVAMLVKDFGYVVASNHSARNGRAPPQRAKAARRNSKRDEAWAQTALDTECARIATTSNGRNNALNDGAYNVFQIIAGTPGLLDEQEVRQRLFEAAEACGLVGDDGAEQCWRTIESGAAAGRLQPRMRPQALLEQPASVGGGLGLATAGAGFGAGATAATATPASAGVRRVVQVRDGDKSGMLDEVEDELVRYQGFGLYQRGGQLVRTILIRTADADNRSTLIWRLAPVDHAHLFEVFTRIVDFQRYDRRSKDWVPTDCPSQLPAMYEARRHWQVPTLLGVVHTPQLRADGSLVEAAGYNPDTRLQFKFDGEVFPPIPARPTKADADASLKVIEEAISTFPFKTAVDRAVALSMFLTALARRSFDLAPVHAITAPTSGTGKSLLVSLASILVCGQTAPVIAMGDDKNEFRKLFASQLLSGTPIIAIDNCEQPLTGDLLCQAISEEQKEIRLFGHLHTAVVRAGSLITATGNNLVIGSDMSRRVLMSMLDAGVERPERRVFKVRIKTLFRQRRGELVAALLTVLRAARLARAEIEWMQLAPLGGFEGWCAWIRDPLVWLGRADPVDSVEASYENNVDRETLQTVVRAWRDSIAIGAEPSAQEVIDRASAMGAIGFYCPALREALLLVAEDRRSPGNLSAKRLGWWLRKVNGQPVDNMRLVKVKNPHGHSHWRLETV